MASGIAFDDDDVFLVLALVVPFAVVGEKADLRKRQLIIDTDQVRDDDTYTEVRGVHGIAAGGGHLCGHGQFKRLSISPHVTSLSATARFLI